MLRQSHDTDFKRGLGAAGDRAGAGARPSTHLVRIAGTTLASVAQPCCTLDMVLRPLAVLLLDPSPLLDSGLTQLRRLLLDQLLLQRVSTRLLGRGRMSHLVKHLLHGM